MNTFSKTLAPEFARFQPVPIPFNHLTALKWLAVISMVADHLRYLPGMDLPALFYFGRIAFPLFCFVLSYHAARAFLLDDDAMLERIVFRLMGYGLIAQVPFALFFGKGPWELNILLTFALAVGLTRMPLLISVLAFIFFGAIVDYSWPGLLFFLACFSLHVSMMRSQPLGVPLALLTGSFLLLSITVSHWICFLAAPIMFWSVVGRLGVSLPRWNFFFYLFYPAHLGLLVVTRSMLT